MKRTYTDYLNELSGNRMDVLEELITKKYRKFRKFYKIVSKHSSDIAHVSYRFSQDSSLDIDITVNPGIDIDEFINDISVEADEKYLVNVGIDTRVIYFSIESND